MSGEADPDGAGRGGGLAARGGGGGTALVAFTARTLQQVAQFVVTLLAARFLVPAEYGVYTLAVVFVSLAQTLTYTGVFHFVVTTKGEEKPILDTAFWLIAGMGTLGALALALASPAIATLYDAPELRTVLLWLALIQPLAAYTAWASAVLMRRERLRLHFGIMIAQNAVALVGGVALLVAWQSIFALVAFRYLRIVSGAGLYAAVGRALPGAHARWRTAREALRYSTALYGTRVLNFLSNYGADLVLGLVFSTAEAGLYRFGNRLATAAVDIVSQPLRAFALTQFGAANRADRPFAPLLARFVMVTLLLSGIVAAGIALLGEGAVHVVFQPSYAAALGVTYALAARAVLGLGNQLVEPVLAARGRTGAVMGHHLGWTSVQVAVIALAAPLGLVPLAVSQMLATAAASAGGLVLIGRIALVPLGPVLRSGARAALFVGAFALLAWIALALGDLAGATSPGPFALACLAVGALALLTLAVAYRARILDPRVFSG